MQFYENGYRFGDPATVPSALGHDEQGELPEEVDVLIVGAGPAGSILGAQLAAFPDVNVRMIERRNGPLQIGQADGVACRTVEMLEAFGLADRLLSEAYWVNETVFWRPDEEQRSQIVRTGRVQDVEEGLSEFPHVIVNQARLQQYLLERMAASPRRLVPDYDWELAALEIPEDSNSPIIARLASAQGRTRSIRAQYVVGCDGARSAVRRSIGVELAGDAQNHAWGVMDVLAVTDFPDFRFKAAVQGGNGRNLLIIPREGGYLNRIYVDLGSVTDRAAVRAMTLEEVIDVVRSVLVPYTFDVRDVAWFSIYEVGQRLADRFDDVVPGHSDSDPRVFITGDACHTHSAKAGQGMNVSMQDAFNLGWKLSAVVRGTSPRSLLRTYSAERQPVAQELIDFDKKWSSLMAAGPRDVDHPELGGVDPAELQAYFVQSGRYTAGVATRYGTSDLTGDGRHQELATGFEVGTRFHSAPVTRIADAKRIELGHVARADGAWRLYAFEDAGGRRLRTLLDLLSSDHSPIARVTETGADADTIIDLRGVLQTSHRDIDPSLVHPALRPLKGRFSVVDYEKAFSCKVGADPDIFERRGVDRVRGALIVVRPDQFIGNVLPLDAFEALTDYFDRVLLSAER